jgi:endonuclease/exonuclease/phosphatase family metal-dependent hydrolase
VVASIRQSEADVVVLVDVSPAYVRSMSGEADLTDLYPYGLRRGPVPDLTGWRVVLSRWPIEDRRTPTSLRCVVQRPGGAFALLGLHPASPRDGGRWRRGNELVASAGDAARAFAAEGLPVIVAGDLNSTASGWRDRLLCSGGGLRRCKPRLGAEGTFPAGVPGLFRLALDDAWVSGHWRVGEWSVGPSAGSDHASVLVELVLDSTETD